jgi:allantoinase
MSVDVLVRGGQVVGSHDVRAANVVVDRGIIVDVTTEAPPAKQEIDATGLHVFPGVIDPHVHFNEPGRVDWEGVATGSSALAAGGGTTYFDMPLNSHPPVLDGATFDAKVAASTGKAYADFALWGGLTPVNLDKLDELADRGVIGFKAFMSNSGIEEFGRADDLTLYRGMKVAANRGLIVAVHAESEEMTSRLAAEAVAAGKTTARDFALARPIVAEVEAIMRAILLAEETGCRLHIVHVSNCRGVELVHRSAARKEADVTCETCAHYLTFTVDDLERIGPAAKCAPPLRSAAEVNELWQDVADGKIAFVSSDHSPAPASMKTGPFWQAWGGIGGVQSTLPVLLSRRPQLPLPQIANLISGTVAERFGMKSKGQVKVGSDADLALVDLRACYELKRDDLLDRHKLSPYVGRTFHGRVRRTILRGQTTFADGKIVGAPTGRLLKPSK